MFTHSLSGVSRQTFPNYEFQDAQDQQSEQLVNPLFLENEVGDHLSSINYHPTGGGDDGLGGASERANCVGPRYGLHRSRLGECLRHDCKM
jgi:hypothetical protein